MAARMGAHQYPTAFVLLIAGAFSPTAHNCRAPRPPRAGAALCTQQASASIPRSSLDQDARDLAARLRALFESWMAIRSESAQYARAAELRAELGSALTAYVLRKLDMRQPPATREIEQEADSALATAAWESVLNVPASEARRALESNRPRFCFVLRGAGDASTLYVAGFAAGWGNVYSDFIHGFSRVGARYRVVGTVGSELDSAIPAAIRLRSFGPNEIRFLVWGLHIGSPEGLTTVAVYNFDGKRLQTLWLRQNVPAAKVTLRRGLVLVESNSRSFLKGAPVFQYERRFYRQVPAGLKELRIQRWTEH